MRFLPIEREEISTEEDIKHVVEAVAPAAVVAAAGMFCRLQVAGCRLKQLVYLSQSRINPNIEANRKQPKLI